MEVNRSLFLLLLAGLLATLGGTAACTGFERLGSVHTAKTVSYVPGVPNFDVEAVGLRDPANPGVRLHLGIPPASLVFLRDSARFRASYDVYAELYDSTGRHLVERRVWSDTVWSESDRTSDYVPLTRTRRIASDPGSYLLRVVLRDDRRERPAERIQRVTVPVHANEDPYLGNLRLQHTDPQDTFRTITQLHLPSRLDSLRAVAHLYPAVPTRRVDVQWALVRYASDNSIADPPYWLTPSQGSLEYLGIDYGSTDTLAASRATYEGITGLDSLTYLLPTLTEGMYRVVLRAKIHPVDGPPRALEKWRDVSVKNPHFPEVASQDAFIESLAYIARDREIEHITSTESATDRRARFDSFWGDLARNEAHAARLLETYYARVQEANLYFTTHKAGWKTDRGMLYVVMGPPVEIEHYVDRETWYYGYPTRDPRRVFVFERAGTYDDRGLTFENYVLRRQPYYQRDWENHVYDWRRGRIL